MYRNMIDLFSEKNFMDLYDPNPNFYKKGNRNVYIFA